MDNTDHTGFHVLYIVNGFDYRASFHNSVWFNQIESVLAQWINLVNQTKTELLKLNARNQLQTRMDVIEWLLLHWFNPGIHSINQHKEFRINQLAAIHPRLNNFKTFTSGFMACCCIIQTGLISANLNSRHWIQFLKLKTDRIWMQQARSKQTNSTDLLD